MQQAGRINPDMVILAREYRALTQKALAEAAGIKQPQIAMIEGGVDGAASVETIASISRALDFPVEFFYQNEPRLGFGSSSVYYRRMSSITASDRKAISSITNIARIGLKRLLEAVDIDADLPLPQINLDDDGQSPSKAASIVRGAWRLPDGPIQNLTNLVERAGVVVIECDFGIRGISGTGMRLADMPPLVFINSALAPDRYRFTLAHELAHLVLHDVPRETMEDEADEFAAELLMQRADFKANLTQFGRKPALRDLIQIKPYWKVSIAAMIMRAGQLGVLSETEKRSLYIQMSNLKMRLEEPQPFSKEQPKLYANVVKAALEDLPDDDTMQQKIMKMPYDIFRRLYASFLRAEIPGVARLRLV